MVQADTSHHEIAGPTWGEFIKEQLEEERARKDSFERRGMAVVTSSSFLATVLFGLGTFARTKAQIADSNVIRWCIIGGVAGFLLAAIFGVAANWIRAFKEADADGLKRVVEEDRLWNQSAEFAERELAKNRHYTLIKARGKNNTKSHLLKIAMGLEIGAAAAVGVAVYLVLVSV